VRGRAALGRIDSFKRRFMLHLIKIYIGAKDGQAKTNA